MTTAGYLRRIALLAATVLVLLTLSAVAEPFGPEEELAYAIAGDYWGRAPDCPSVAKSVEPIPYPEAGEAPPCAMRISPIVAIVFARECPTIVHEYGHLIGEPHSADPLNVMAPELTTANLRSVPGCNAVVDARAAESAASELRAQRRSHWEDWRARCRTYPSRRCWAWTKRARVRFEAVA